MAQHLIFTDKLAGAHNMPFNVQLQQYALGLLHVSCSYRKRIFDGLMTGKYYDKVRGNVVFYGDYGNKYENKTTQKKNKTTNLNHHVIESAMKQIEDVLHDSDSDDNPYLIESAKKQIGYTSDDSDSDDESMLFLN